MFRRIAVRITTLVAAMAAGVAALPAGAANAAPPKAGVVRFVGAPGTTFAVGGQRYIDTIEFRLGPGGMTTINELSMDAYVEGLAEMPASWHMEALKAQAVAARTYAWFSIELGTFRHLGYDICVTVDCQVFHGRATVSSRYGERWRQAVAETSNEVLTWEGEPILARFFSSSGGHTRDNEDVYGYGKITDGPKPYLKGVPDPDDRISPHHHWSFGLRVAEMNRVLSRGATLEEVVPIRFIRHIPGDGKPDGNRIDQIRFRGKNGKVVEMSASKFRAWFSEVGPRVLPHRFPIRAANGSPLPDGLPTSRLDFRFDQKRGYIVVHGYGWGHGVGMSQWGARGKAERGMGYADILAAYYNGLRPERTPDLPSRVRVGLGTSNGPVRIRANGHYRVEIGDQAAPGPGGTFTLRPAKGGIDIAGPRLVDFRPAPPKPVQQAAAPEAQERPTPPAAAGARTETPRENVSPEQHRSDGATTEATSEEGSVVDAVVRATLVFLPYGVRTALELLLPDLISSGPSPAPG
ncbi:MAG: SpoIID/LytB domain-containing protein [Nitriliruptorales bacterium]